MTKTAWLALFLLLVLALPADAQNYVTSGGVSIDDIGNTAMGATMGVIKWILTFSILMVGILCAVHQHWYGTGLCVFAAIVIIFSGPGMLQKIPGFAALGTF